MSPTDERCVDFAEVILEDELARTGTDPAVAARVLSLAAAIQDAVEAWYAANPGEVEP